jgi:uncharacterized protein (TIGR03437 family)
LRKYTVDGEEQWTRYGVLTETNYGVATDATGIYVSGRSGSGGFLRKYDVAGDELWMHPFGWTGQSPVNTVSADASGIYVGATVTSAPGQCRSGALDVFVRKYDAAGNDLWTRQFGAAGSDLFHGLALGASAVYVAGVVHQPEGPPRPLLAEIKKLQAPDNDTRPRINCIANAASNVDIMPIILFGPDDPGIAPGEIVTVYGRMIGPDESAAAQVMPGGSLGTSLAGVRVFFNGLAARILYVSADQINAIAPSKIAERDSVEIEIEYQGERSNRVTARVVRAAPGIFTRDGSGVGQALAVNEDGTLNSLANPARLGSAITIYSTGAGPSDRAVPDGEILGDAVTIPRAPVSVWACCDWIYGFVEEPYRLEVLDSAGVPGSVAGLLKTRVRLSRVTATQLPVAMQIGAAMTDWQVHVAVQFTLDRR